VTRAHDWWKLISIADEYDYVKLKRNKNWFKKMSDFFFLDDMDVEKNYISISIGEVWLYFYKETLIGTRDMRTNKVAFLRVDEVSKEDGYSHRHEITNEVVEQAMKEPYPVAGKPKRLPADELSALAIEWVAAGMVKHIDHALT
jgi:hypothetical protein